MAEAIPEPASLESVMASDLAEGGTPVLIAAPEVAARLVSVDVDVPEDALRKSTALPRVTGSRGPGS